MHRVVDDVLIGLPVKSHYDEIQQSLAACARVGVPASYSADLFGGASAHPSPAGHVCAGHVHVGDAEPGAAGRQAGDRRGGRADAAGGLGSR